MYETTHSQDVTWDVVRLPRGGAHGEGFLRRKAFLNIWKEEYFSDGMICFWLWYAKSSFGYLISFFFFCVLRLNSHFFFLHSDDETVCRCLWYLIFFLIFSFFYSDVSSHFLFLSVFFNKTFTFRQHVCPIEAAIKVKPISQRQLKINPVLLFKR